MKFTKEELRKRLADDLTNNGKKPLRMSSRTLNEQSDLFFDLFDDDNTELEDLVKRILPAFESVNSNIGHDVSEAVKAFKADPKNNPEPDPGKTKVDNPDPKDDGKGDDALKKLQEQIDTLIREREEERSKAAVTAKRNELRTFLKGKNVESDEWINGILEIATVDADTDVAAKGEALLKLYNKQRSDVNEYTPAGSRKSGGKEPEDYSDVAQILKRQRGDTGNV